jgi:hypothetical protein
MTVWSVIGHETMIIMINDQCDIAHSRRDTVMYVPCSSGRAMGHACAMPRPEASELFKKKKEDRTQK